MDDLLAARSQMAISLGFQIIFTMAGMALPWLIIIAEGLWLRTRRYDYGGAGMAQPWGNLA